MAQDSMKVPKELQVFGVYHNGKELVVDINGLPNPVYHDSSEWVVQDDQMGPVSIGFIDPELANSFAQRVKRAINNLD